LVPPRSLTVGIGPNNSFALLRIAQSPTRARAAQDKRKAQDNGISCVDFFHEAVELV
jgi:hypothetical protein